MYQGLRDRVFKVFKGFFLGCLTGTVLLVFGLALWATMVLIGFGKAPSFGEACDIVCLGPLYILSFGLAGSVVVLLWRLTSNWLGALVVGIAASAIVVTECSIIMFVLSLLEPDLRIDFSPGNTLMVGINAVVMGCMFGLMLRWARKKQPGRTAAPKDG
jgi:hypothetical protein